MYFRHRGLCNGVPSRTHYDGPFDPPFTSVTPTLPPLVNPFPFRIGNSDTLVCIGNLSLYTQGQGRDVLQDTLNESSVSWNQKG